MLLYTIVSEANLPTIFSSLFLEILTEISARRNTVYHHTGPVTGPTPVNWFQDITLRCSNKNVYHY